MGFPFLRQRPIGNYIVDFFCKELSLVIEVDGLTHQWEENVEKDRLKEQNIQKLGYNILRFTDDEVINIIADVHRPIDFFIESHPPPLAQPQAPTAKRTAIK